MKRLLMLLIGFVFTALSNVSLASDVETTKVAIEYEQGVSEKEHFAPVEIEKVLDERICLEAEVNLDTTGLNYPKRKGREFVASSTSLNLDFKTKEAERRSRSRKSLQHKELKPNKGVLKRPAKKWVYSK